jgi:hypothetical protein
VVLCGVVLCGFFVVEALFTSLSRSDVFSFLCSCCFFNPFYFPWCMFVCLFLQLCDGVLCLLRVQACVRGEQPPGGFHLRALLPRELEGAAAPTGE